MRQYGIDQVELGWMGLDFKEGLSVGTSITEARGASAWSIVPTGAKPRVTRVYNTDRSGTVSIVVDQTSLLHQQLKDIARQDVLTRDQVGVMLLNDTSSGEKINWKNAFIMTEPDKSRGTEMATFTWVFAFEDFDDAPVASPTNLVGA